MPRQHLVAALAVACCALGVFGSASGASVKANEDEAACSGLSCQELGADGAHEDADSAEAELLRVSMLQMGLAIGHGGSLAGRRATADGALHSGSEPRTTVIRDGAVEVRRGAALASELGRAQALEARPDLHLTQGGGGWVEQARESRERGNGSWRARSRPHSWIHGPLVSEFAGGPCGNSTWILSSEEVGGECIRGFTPLGMYVQLEVYRAMGLFPENPKAKPPLLIELEVDKEHGGPLHTRAEHFIVKTYYLFYIVSCLMMYCWLVNPHDYFEEQGKNIDHVDAETQVWEESLLHWLAVSWASPWVAKWGDSTNAAHTKISAKELPRIGGEEHQALGAASMFERLWQREVEDVGLEEASLVRVLVRLWSFRTMAYLMLVLVFQVLLEQIYSVFLVQNGLNYFRWLQRYILVSGESPSVATPLVVSIFSFLVDPSL